MHFKLLTLKIVATTETQLSAIKLKLIVDFLLLFDLIELLLFDLWWSAAVSPQWPWWTSGFPAGTAAVALRSHFGRCSAFRLSVPPAPSNCPGRGGETHKLVHTRGLRFYSKRPPNSRSHHELLHAARSEWIAGCLWHQGLYFRSSRFWGIHCVVVNESSCCYCSVEESRAGPRLLRVHVFYFILKCFHGIKDNI